MPSSGSAALDVFFISLKDELAPKLSSSALITVPTDPEEKGYTRWSEYNAPTPGAIVTPATEQDVAAIVQHCISHGIPFLAQSGGHGWSSTLNLDHSGIIISLRKLNTVTFSYDGTEATIEGGALISEVMEAASQKSSLVITGNCNCVGALGAALGGGYGYLTGLQGLAIDNIISLTVVTGTGTLKTVTADSDPDLFWALRGAAPNFGIVTSIVMKAYPVEASGQYAWIGALVYPAEKVEAVIRAISKLTLTPKMNVFFYFLTSGAPNFIPQIAVTPWYYGTETEGRAAFASVIDIGPIADTTKVMHYPRWNDGAAHFCVRGGYRPGFGVALSSIVPETWMKVWDEYVSWTSLSDTGSSVVLMEAYCLNKIRSVPNHSSSFPWRSTVAVNAIALPFYTDKKLEAEAVLLGQRIRSLLQSTDGLGSRAMYVNFAHGDEDPAEVYGLNLPRLQEIKAKEDPNNFFCHWFGLARRLESPSAAGIGGGALDSTSH
ncbi:FAD binding domain-containing protein [Nannizzia gypsea CBS 118893]|uniref:FAD binding domain-containing protein n=1 Tax=Arthroderma gypseum (strain ATCC MYA-4604 / CBS 118893) TaxID=535722 RepID=E4UZN1_ARTGP|nr:FAD binding domain-containing protein [Nannizzia gypsea CBS 118893]EFR03561.1 FAD binding domain-containing protein [Nannizzia gypsea CBS 118893]